MACNAYRSSKKTVRLDLSSHGGCSRFDILFVADPRFEGGTSTALKEEIEASHRAKLRTGLLMVKGSLLGRANLWMHPDIRALVDTGAVEIVDHQTGIAVDLTIVHHPTIFALP